MKNKIKIISNLCLILLFILILSISSYATSLSSVTVEKWGTILAENTKNMECGEVYAVGRNSVVTNRDIDQATESFKLSGMDEQSAREEAIKYMSQREALYQAAIENGYSVTDKEVWDYLDELKVTINNADNKEDAFAIISQFETEEDYWNFEFSVYQKNLPIQRYVHDLEQAFMQSSGDSDKSFATKESEWDQYFEQLKEELVLEEEYQVVN